MNTLLEHVTEFCSSVHFFLGDIPCNEHSESLLQFWCDRVTEPVNLSSIEKSLRDVGALSTIPVEIRRNFPNLLKHFFTYLDSTGRLPGAGQWTTAIESIENTYRLSLRDDGTMRGETYLKKYTDINRNDPCPCGSGKKFKKCCLSLISG